MLAMSTVDWISVMNASYSLAIRDWNRNLELVTIPLLQFKFCLCDSQHKTRVVRRVSHWARHLTFRGKKFFICFTQGL